MCHRLDSLTQRLAKLEELNNYEAADSPAKGHIASNASSLSSTSPSNIEALNAKQSRYREYGSQEIKSQHSPPHKRHKSQHVISSTAHQVHSPGSTHHVFEARSHIEHELQCNQALSQDRRTALESARRFVSHLSNPTLHWEQTAATDGLEVDDDQNPPSLTPELLYMMLPGK